VAAVPGDVSPTPQKKKVKYTLYIKLEVIFVNSFHHITDMEYIRQIHRVNKFITEQNNSTAVFLDHTEKNIQVEKGEVSPVLN
jgi:hypothetical protein